MAARSDDERGTCARRGKARLVGPFLVLAAFGAAVGCAGSDGSDVDDGPSSVAQPIRGGSIDTETKAVFAMAVRQGSEDVSLCTATLIERNLFLTARHCLVPTTRVVRCGTSEFEDPMAPLAVALVNSTELDEDALQNAPVFHGVALYLPSTPDVCGADIALVETTERVPESVATPIEPQLTQFPSRGDIYEAVGYGGTREGGSGSGIRRSRQDLTVVCSGECGTSIASSEFLGEVGTCEGDSGGPALDADGNIIGVLSRGGDNCSSPIYGSTAAWAHLISSAAQSAADRGGYRPPDWSQGDFPPDPGTSPPSTPSGSGGSSSGSSGASGCSWTASPRAGGTAALWFGVALLGALHRRRSRAPN